ncbi:hypothetical protein BDFB_008581 [Asbolus verrucosus]|uniref:Uncharacterized protein n=1 Tax=Asbolus verrucosus TaxID=1661398 RepID=A0A482WDN3_ASBVE|nr:hypothetical protein BDFB_008581 [Asbolus verrucosus]
MMKQNVDTPDSVLQSGLGLTDLGQHAVLRSMVDPRDYDRLRHLQMNGGAPNTFEETIYKVELMLMTPRTLLKRSRLPSTPISTYLQSVFFQMVT